MTISVGDIVRFTDADPNGELLGIVERVGKQQIKVNFRRLPWTPSSLKLPEIREFPRELVERCRDPWSDWANGRISDLEQVMQRIRCVELWLANNQGQLGNARTDLLPHQVCLVHEVVERKRRRLLIAEEVGMGKTIETGMIIHALKQRRELERCLVVCPAGQIGQWQEELEEKLLVRFEVYRRDIDGQRAFGFPMVIASLDTLKLDTPNSRLRGKSHQEILMEAPEWDLVVFDEAHRLTARSYGAQTGKTLNYRLAEELSKRTRDFIFLTGTPHDGNDSKFSNLLKTLEPEVVFSREQKGVFFGNLILKNRKSEARDANGELLFKNVMVEKMSLDALSSGEAQFHSFLNDYLKEGYGVAEQDRDNPRNRALGFVMTTFQKLASSSAAAVRSALQKRLARLKKLKTEHESLKEQDSSETDGRFSGEEEESTAEEIQARELRDAFTKMEVAMLDGLLALPVPEEAKLIELFRLIQAGITQSSTEKFLIFTEYRGTLKFLEEALAKKYGVGSVAIIKGGIGAEARMEAMTRFRSDPTCQFLISTEAGGEGINLQFCNIVVNYDQPWNPFRVVQRIGRVHRIGQHRNMRVINYRLRNELDDRLSDCHEQRVESAVSRLSEVTGLVPSDIRDQLLGFAQDFINYDKVFGDSMDMNGTRSSEKEITEGISRAEEAFRVAYETIFKHAVEPFNPDRFKKIAGASLTLKELHQWLDGCLKSNGRRLMHRRDEDLYEFLVPENCMREWSSSSRSVQGTFDRSRSMKEQSVDLLAFGHPAIDLIARNAVAPDSGGFVAAVKPPQDDLKFSKLVVALLQTDNHAGASAHQLLYVRQDTDGNWSLKGSESLRGLVKSSDQSLFEVEPTKFSLEEFLEESFPDVEFVAERLHYIAILVA